MTMKRITLALAAAVTLLVTASACSPAYDADRAASPDHHRGPGPVFQDYGVNPVGVTAEENRSTFALDVDTGSYTVTRGYLNDGVLPDPASVRTEEFINYFDQDYPVPPDGIGIHVDGTPVPFLPDPAIRVVRVGLQGAAVDDAERRPVNLTIIVDTSGSMAGHNIQMVRGGLGRLVDSLRPDDAMAIVTFSTTAELRLEMTPATRKDRIRAVIAALEPQQSTNLEAGLRLGYRQAMAHLREDGLNRVVLLSDGVANVGETDPHRLAAQIAQEAGRSTQLVVVGVGRETYNEVILEQFANNGNGFYAYVDSVREAERLFVDDLTGTLQAVALDAKVQVTFNPETVSHFRLLGYENRQLAPEDLRDDTVDGGEVGAGHTVTALYEVRLHEQVLREVARPWGDAPLATVDVRWIDPDHGEPRERGATITAAGLAPSWEQAPPRLRQDITVAAFAECLRHAPWSRHVSIAGVADHAWSLARTLPHDEQVSELARIARTAADLSS
jgi:Ca-activated chloride channel homolog